MMRPPNPFAPKNRLLTFAGLCVFILGVVAAAPASLAAMILQGSSPLLDIGGSTGTIWRGSFSNVAYNNINLGEIRFSLKASGLVAGRAIIDIATGGGALSSKGRVSLSPFDAELRDANARFDLSAIRQYTFLGARYQGVVDLSLSSIILSRNGCKVGSATVSTTMLDSMARQWSGAAFPLEGGVECVDGKLVLSLSGENGGGSLQFSSALSPDFSYMLEFDAKPKRAEIGEALRQFGFEGDNTQMTLRAVGRLRGLSS